MKRLSFTAFLCFAIMLASNAQSNDYGSFEHKNNVHVWAGGPGFIYNFSYERLIVNTPYIKFSMEAGASYYPASSGIIGLWIPMTANQTFFAKNHHLETGIGIVFTNEDKPFGNQQKLVAGFGMFKIGYRYQRPEGRFIFRAAFTPFIELERFGNSGESFTRELRGNFINRTHAWGGVSFGYCF